MKNNLEDKVKNRVKELKDKELKLFHSYNRHGTNSFKLAILNDLSSTIKKIDELETLLK